MMKLKPEYLNILNRYTATNTPFGMSPIERAVRDCQALADRPTKMLTNGEICALMNEHGYANTIDYAHAIEVAHIRKQSAPDVVPFNYEQWSKGGWIALNDGGFPCDAIIAAINYPSMVRTYE